MSLQVETQPEPEPEPEHEDPAFDAAGLRSPSSRSYGLSLQRAREEGQLCYRSLKRTPIREKADADSAQIGELAEQEVFEVVSETKSDDGLQRFVQTLVDGDTKGWVNMNSSSGKPLCVTEAAVQHLLASVPLLQHLPEDERAEIAEKLDADDIAPGVKIVSVGELGHAMFLLEKGTAVAEVASGEHSMSYRAGDYFGELALLTDEPRKATVRAGPGGARCLKLDRKHFDKFADSCTAILDERRKQYAHVHRIDISTHALKSYLADPDLRDKAAEPSETAIDVLRQVIFFAPARVRINGRFERIDRRVTDDSRAEDLFEYDIDLVTRVWLPAMGRVLTTFATPSEREAEAERLLYSSKQKSKSGRAVEPSQTPSRRHSDVSVLATPAATPERSFADAAIPEGMPPRTPRGGMAGPDFPLTDQAKNHVRNFIAIARDIDNMLAKYGMTVDDVLQAFADFSQPQEAGTEDELADGLFASGFANAALNVVYRQAGEFRGMPLYGEVGGFAAIYFDGSDWCFIGVYTEEAAAGGKCLGYIKPTGELLMRVELESMQVGALQARANAAEVDKEAVAAALRADAPVGALVALIMEGVATLAAKINLKEDEMRKAEADQAPKGATKPAMAKELAALKASHEAATGKPWSAPEKPGQSKAVPLGVHAAKCWANGGWQEERVTLSAQAKHREPFFSCDAAEQFCACLAPFANRFVQCDELADPLMGHWATVDYLRPVGSGRPASYVQPCGFTTRKDGAVSHREMADVGSCMVKVAAKVLVKLYDPRTNLFLVEWAEGAGRAAGEESWVQLRNVQLSGWLGAKATARDASAKDAADASRRRCPGKR